MQMRTLKRLGFLGTALTRARMLGSTATTSERHFIALVLTAMALSPRTLKIYRHKWGDVLLICNTDNNAERCDDL